MTMLPKPRRTNVDPDPWSAAESLDVALDARTATLARVLDILPSDGAPIPANEFYTQAEIARPRIATRTAEFWFHRAEADGLVERLRDPDGGEQVLYRRVPTGEWMARFTHEWYAFDMNEDELREFVDVPPLDAKRERVAGRLAGGLISGLWSDDLRELRALKRALEIKRDSGEDSAVRWWDGWIRERNRRIDGRFGDLHALEILWGEDATGLDVDNEVALRAATIAMNAVETVRRTGPRVRPVAKPGRESADRGAHPPPVTAEE